MSDVRYGTSREPRWHAMVSPTCVLVLDRTLSADRVLDVWASVAAGVGVQVILDALTRGGISTTPNFALALLPTGFGAAPAAITTIVRGALELAIATPAETVRFSGEGVSTWVERAVPDATALRIGSSVAAGDTRESESFVLNNGSAPIDWLTVGGDAVPTAVPVGTPPVATPPIASPPVVSPEASRIVDPEETITDSTLVTPRDPGESDGGYDFLFGETVVRTVEGAAVRDEPTEQAVAGDHDGRTAVGLSASERRAARLARAKPATSTAPAAAAFVLTFSTGQREVLDSTLIIGRAPSASKVSATSVPRLVTVGGPDQDISRNHVQVSVEGGTVLVTDLHSRNGTLVTLPGRPPQQLRGGQPTAVIGGTVIDLGSGVTFAVGDN